VSATKLQQSAEQQEDAQQRAKLVRKFRKVTTMVICQLAGLVVGEPSFPSGGALRTCGWTGSFGLSLSALLSGA